MANVFYAPGAERAQLVQALFDRIASRYDLINDLQSFGLHRYWKNCLIKLGSPKLGEKVFDVCCGTGDLSFRFTSSGAKVVGLDFSEQMLQIATGRKTKLQNLQLKVHRPQSQVGASSIGAAPLKGNLDFVRGDALRAPFPDESFEVVSIGYGLRNLADWQTGLEEMCRVTKPGGRVLVLDFGKPDNAILRWVYFSYLRLFVPWLGRIFCGDASAYGYILESLLHYPAQRGVAQQMRQIGLANVRIINFLGGVMSINYGERTLANR